jgi:adhesin/invasin
MKRRKSLMVISILLWGLFIISGCGDGVPEGTLNTTGATVTLTADAAGIAGLSAAQSCILTAEVKDKSVTPSATPGTPPTPAPQPLSGQVIAFSFVSNESGATLTPLNGGITDSLGKAYAVYTAGKLKPGLNILDTVQANIKDFSGVVTITRKGGGGSTAGFTISVVAAPASVAAEGTSVITATVTNADGQLVSGQAVSFTFVTNNSGATLTVLNGGVTDAAGKATAQYRAGDNSPDMDFSDTVQASVSGGYTGAVVITRSAGTGTSISVAASPASLNAGQTSIVTATLTGDNKAGVTVYWSLSPNNSGATLSRISSITDGSGKAVVTYTAGANNPNVDVQDTVTAGLGASEIFSSVTITRTAAAASGYSITVTASPTTLPTAGGSSVITATVKKGTAAVSGVTVNFVQSGGTSVLPAAATTDASGNAQTVFADGAGVVGTEAGVVTASITISGSTYTAAVVIKY